MKTTNLFWTCLVVIGICSMILAGVNLMRTELPDFITRGIGVIDLAALLILAYTIVKKITNRN